MSRFRLEVPRAEDKEYEAVVVGAGPAGLTAALYLARYGVKTIVVSKDIGGRMALAPLIEDYPGLGSVPGAKLAELFVNHVKNLGVPIILDVVKDLKKEDNLWCIYTDSGRRICGYVVILAMGGENRKLNVPGEDKFLGRGVSYCATCDGPLFRNKVVAVVGGGNTALVSALYLADIASKVYLIHRRKEFRAYPTYIDKAKSHPKIEFILDSIVDKILGEDKVEGVKVKNIKTSEEITLKIDGIFIEIGVNPPTEFFKKIGIQVDETGRAIVKHDKSTNLPGLYVAGDAAGGPYKYVFDQIVTAAAEGAVAADAAFKYILENIRRT
ncbi:MAG: FAD-dependent oxidoreductase [Ignisphaera sp.]|uniref:FAD-binding protein n=1 Tax=Ignisphaera aggregans TaxID=334771 RepID=A0A7C4NNE7_9CREN